MPAPNSEAAPVRARSGPAEGPSRRWVVLSVLFALAFVSGVGASQDKKQTGVEGNVVASFDAVAIQDLPLHADDVSGVMFIDEQ